MSSSCHSCSNSSACCKQACYRSAGLRTEPLSTRRSPSHNCWSLVAESKLVRQRPVAHRPMARCRLASKVVREQPWSAVRTKHTVVSECRHALRLIFIRCTWCQGDDLTAGIRIRGHQRSIISHCCTILYRSIIGHIRKNGWRSGRCNSRRRGGWIAITARPNHRHHEP